VGPKTPASRPPPPQIPITAPAATASSGGSMARPLSPPPATLSPSSTSVAGGTEVYRIHSDGHPQKVWTHAQDIVYALGFDSQGRVLLGAGNKGAIYRLDTDNLYTVLVNAPPTQVTSFCAGKDGKVY